jgi:hypothetical protein
MPSPPRRFPPPWTVVATDHGYRVDDAIGRTVGWFFGEEIVDVGDETDTAAGLSEDKGKPRLLIQRHSPEKTVAALRDIFAADGCLYDRGALVQITADPAEGGAVAHMMTSSALVLAAHEACRPYVLVKTKDGFDEADAALPQQIAVMYHDYRDWRLLPLSGIASAPLLGNDGSIRTAEGYDPTTGM